MGLLRSAVYALFVSAAASAGNITDPRIFAYPDGVVSQSVLEQAGSQECGGTWQQCCPGSRCLAPSNECDGGSCKPCAAWVWGSCCSGKCPPTISGTRVSCSSSQCQPCGDMWQMPCSDGCKAGLARNLLSGKCEKATAAPSPRSTPSPPRSNPPPACGQPVPRMPPATVPPVAAPVPSVPIVGGPSGKVTLNADGSTNFRASKAASAKWKYPMHEAFGKSMFFYEAQRAGVLPADNRVLWRGDSPAGNVKNDGALTGGWYDAGDHVKFNYPMFSSAARVALATWKYADALAASSFDGASNLYWARREVRWVMDYIVRCHTAPRTLVAQVGDGNLDHGFLGRAEALNMQRPVAVVSDAAPGPDIIAAAAAALANGYMALKDYDPVFASACLSHARDLHEWGRDTFTKDVYDGAVAAARPFYKSTGVNHQLLYSAASLFHATGEVRYRDDAVKFGLTPEAGAYGPFKSYGDWISWDNAWFDGAVLMLEKGVDPGTAVGFKTQISRTVNNWARGAGMQVSPRGQRHISQWGSNRYAVNAAAIALMAAPHLDGAFATTARCFAVSQLHYVWGDAGRSFVVGFGKNAPTRPHHRNSACRLSEIDRCESLWNDPRPNPNVLHGALVGGPPRPDDQYSDDRGDYISSEVAVDYNALYSVATAAAMDLGDGFWGQFPAVCRGSVPGFSF